MVPTSDPHRVMQHGPATLLVGVALLPAPGSQDAAQEGSLRGSRPRLRRMAPMPSSSSFEFRVSLFASLGQVCGGLRTGRKSTSEGVGIIVTSPWDVNGAT